LPRTEFAADHAASPELSSPQHAHPAARPCLGAALDRLQEPMGRPSGRILGRPRRFRPSRGTLPGPSRSRISINPRRRMHSPSRRATSMSRSRISSLSPTQASCANRRSFLRTGTGARPRRRQERAVDFATNTSHSRANSALGAPLNSARVARFIRSASSGRCITASS
jgi:hypothetical protein